MVEPMTALEAFEMCLKLEVARRRLGGYEGEVAEAVKFASDILRRDLRAMLTPTTDAIDEALREPAEINR
jgi:hypothetical protein